MNGRGSHSPWKVLSNIGAIGLLCPCHVFRLILCGLLICDISVTPSQCVNIPCCAWVSHKNERTGPRCGAMMILTGFGISPMTVFLSRSSGKETRINSRRSPRIISECVLGIEPYLGKILPLFLRYILVVNFYCTILYHSLFFESKSKKSCFTIQWLAARDTRAPAGFPRPR